MKKTIIYPLNRRERLSVWRNRLTADLALQAGPRERIEKIFYDSFDWRLYNAGLCLESVEQDSVYLLRLLRLSNFAVLAELGLDSLEIRFATDLPGSRLRQLIEPLLAMRAFLPLATLSIGATCLRYIDAEGKTRVRLHVENCRLITPAGHSRQLLKRLRLEPLRGYDRACASVRTKLERDYQLTGGHDDLYSRTLVRAGKNPGDYSSKLSIALDPGARADVAVRQILQVLRRDIKVNEQGAIEDLDSEFLHDFRVAVRRTRSVLGRLKWVFPPVTGARFRREFGWLGKLTSNVRDLDVYLLKFEAYKAAIPKKLRNDLEPFRNFLRYKQQQEQAGHLAVELQGKRYRRLMRQWQRYLETPLAKRPAAKDATRPISEVASLRIWHMYRRVIKQGRAITPDSRPAKLHALRKSCKKLRYLMEFFQSLYPQSEIRDTIKELKRLQDNLGDFQDLEVQIGAFDRFTMEMRRRGEYSASTGKAMDALLLALRRRMQVTRADFESRFKRFSRRSNCEHFRTLFHDYA